jgi:hypothetical protein
MGRPSLPLTFLAIAGIALAAIISAISAATKTTNMIRLNVATDSIVCCCCPIIFFSFAVVDGFALHLDHGSNRENAHWPKDQSYVLSENSTIG